VTGPPDERMCPLCDRPMMLAGTGYICTTIARVGRAPTVREVEGRLVIDWPNPRPYTFEISAEAFEALIARANGDAS
jgi:hypothetical protein